MDKWIGGIKVDLLLLRIERSQLRKFWYLNLMLSGSP